MNVMLPCSSSPLRMLAKWDRKVGDKNVLQIAIVQDLLPQNNEQFRVHTDVFFLFLFFL